jgi:hypothetical protein
MTSDTQLRQVTAAQLAPARAMTHKAAQHLTRASRANLEPKPDDSHSNIGWDRKKTAFTTHSMEGFFVGLSLSPLRIYLSEGGEMIADLYLNGVSDTDVGHWLDTSLTAKGLSAGSVIDLPYELPEEAAAVDAYNEAGHEEALKTLSAWYDAASHALGKLVRKNTDIKPGPSPVRCWPHHFDIATYVLLEDGDPETARGIGVGMSPGDDGYAEPYFYINPWPHLDKDDLPAAVQPGHWHVEDYVGLIATASEISRNDDMTSQIDDFVMRSFSTAKLAQGT